MRPYRRFESLRQMSYALATFAVAALLLESAGLQHWADRLELGPERTIAVPITNALHRALALLRLERLRRSTLVGLARIRWSDDPEELEEAAGTATTLPSASTAVDVSTVRTPGRTAGNEPCCEWNNRSRTEDAGLHTTAAD